MTQMLKDLEWKPLAERRKDDRLALLYKVLNNLSAITADDFLTYSQTKTRKNHHLTLNLYAPKTDLFKYSFFPRTIVQWNNLPKEVVNAGNLSQFKAALVAH